MDEWEEVEELLKEPIGYIHITNRVKIYVYEPISKFHKFMLKILLGWSYKEQKRK